MAHVQRSQPTVVVTMIEETVLQTEKDGHSSQQVIGTYPKQNGNKQNPDNTGHKRSDIGKSVAGKLHREEDSLGGVVGEGTTQTAFDSEADGDHGKTEQEGSVYTCTSGEDEPEASVDSIGTIGSINKQSPDTTGDMHGDSGKLEAGKLHGKKGHDDLGEGRAEGSFVVSDSEGGGLPNEVNVDYQVVKSKSAAKRRRRAERHMAAQREQVLADSVGTTDESTREEANQLRHAAANHIVWWWRGRLLSQERCQALEEEYEWLKAQIQAVRAAESEAQRPALLAMLMESETSEGWLQCRGAGRGQ